MLLLLPGAAEAALRTLLLQHGYKSIAPVAPVVLCWGLRSILPSLQLFTISSPSNTETSARKLRHICPKWGEALKQGKSGAPLLKTWIEIDIRVKTAGASSRLLIFWMFSDICVHLVAASYLLSSTQRDLLVKKTCGQCQDLPPFPPANPGKALVCEETVSPSSTVEAPTSTELPGIYTLTRRRDTYVGRRDAAAFKILYDNNHKDNTTSKMRF